MARVLDNQGRLKEVYIGAESISGGKETLKANRSYYVALSGSDINNGLSPSTAFKTIQKAIDYVAENIDTATYTVTINIADGGYTISGRNDGITLRPVSGVGRIVLLGNLDYPENVNIVFESDVYYGIVYQTSGCRYYLQGLKLSANYVARSQSAFYISHGAVLYYGNIIFGQGWARHFWLLNKGYAEAVGGYTVEAGTRYYHIDLQEGSLFKISYQTVKLLNTPAFTSGFCNVTEASIMKWQNMTLSGTATGKRYTLSLNGIIDTAGGGTSYLPGNSAGGTASGGQYI